MIEEDIRHLAAERIPLVRRLGLSVLEVSASGARVHLPFDTENTSHAGGLHAGAQFTAAETAALVSCFAALGRAEATCHTKTCELRFRKPGRTELWASAQLREDAQTVLTERLTAEGKVDVPVLVELTDATGERIAEGTVTVSVRRI